MRYPGKSASRLRFLGRWVLKTEGDAPEQYEYMRAHPEVFLPVQKLPFLRGYVMPREQSATRVEELLIGLDLLKVLWETEPQPLIPEGWRDHYALFISRCCTELQIGSALELKIVTTAYELPDEPWVVNHGDPTLGNLVATRYGYRWIDPAQRSFSPRTISAEIARMWQSTYLKYEQRFFSQRDFKPDIDFSRMLCRRAGVAEQVVRQHLVLFTVRLARHLRNPHLRKFYLQSIERQLCELS